MDRVLVTGGRGFIGRHLMEALRARGAVVDSYDLVDGLDVLDEDRLAWSVGSRDVVFDCAGVLGSEETIDHIARTVDVNIKGTLNVLAACKKYDIPMVFLSLKTDWHNPYLITKRAATEFCQMYSEYLGLRVAVVRGLNVYGPRQHWGRVRKAVPTFIVAALKGQPLTVFGDGSQITDQIYVSDLCEILIRTWERGCWGDVFDGGTGVPTSVNRLAYSIKKATGSGSDIIYLPMRKGEPMSGGRQLADTTYVRQQLGYEPQVGLVKGLTMTIAWYREHMDEVYDCG